MKLQTEKTYELENIQIMNDKELKYLKDNIVIKETTINELKNNIKEINNNHNIQILNFKKDFEIFNNRSINMTIDNKNLHIEITNLENQNKEANIK